MGKRFKGIFLFIMAKEKDLAAIAAKVR